MFANANFRQHDSSGKYTDQPFEPAHFLGDELRAQPVKADPLKAYNDARAVIRANQELAKMAKGVVPEGLDDKWTRPYQEKAN